MIHPISRQFLEGHQIGDASRLHLANPDSLENILHLEAESCPKFDVVRLNAG